MEAVRPEFRAEVFRATRNDTVFVRGDCRLVNCPNVVDHSARGVCNSHYQRWLRTRGEDGDFEAWLSGEDERLARRAAAAVGKSALMGTRSRSPPAPSSRLIPSNWLSGGAR